MFWQSEEKCKGKTSDDPPVNITNHLSLHTSQNGYMQYLQVLAQYPALRCHPYT